MYLVRLISSNQSFENIAIIQNCLHQLLMHSHIHRPLLTYAEGQHSQNQLICNTDDMHYIFGQLHGTRLPYTEILVKTELQ